MSLLNNFLFIALPYLAFTIALVGSIYRYRRRAFSVSSLSSQFLDDGGIRLFSLLLHWGILALLIGHLGAFLLPKTFLTLHSDPARVWVIEVIALTFGLCVLVGLLGLILRRLVRARLRVVTSPMDIVIELLLLAQIVLGLWIAIGYRWGYYWFAADLSPYLWSILALDPQIEAVGSMPLVIRLHIVGAFVILGVLPFTRLVHFLVAPVHYSWRRYQQVLWYWERKRLRDPDSVWSKARPKNN